jgi:hypothetical protein
MICACVFKSSLRKLRGQHINSCSRVIHTLKITLKTRRNDRPKTSHPLRFLSANRFRPTSFSRASRLINLGNKKTLSYTFVSVLTKISDYDLMSTVAGDISQPVDL